jgi:hypothetical protein
MRPLSAGELLQVWEWGQNRHPVDRALAILAMAWPEKTWEEITYLHLGQRDGELLALRECMFGPYLSGYAACPACGDELEFELDTSGLPKATPVSGEQIWNTDGLQIHFRYPNSRDLAALAQTGSVDAARTLLLERIITQIRQGQTKLTVQELPPEIGTSLQEYILESEPLLEIQLALSCPACEHAWNILLDISTYLWAEISAQAQRLLGEVHLLASAYGWSEAEILGISEHRRARYLEMVLA